MHTWIHSYQISSLKIFLNEFLFLKNNLVLQNNSSSLLPNFECPPSIFNPNPRPLPRKEKLSMRDHQSLYNHLGQDLGPPHISIMKEYPWISNGFPQPIIAIVINTDTSGRDSKHLQRPSIDTHIQSVWFNSLLVPQMSDWGPLTPTFSGQIFLWVFQACSWHLFSSILPIYIWISGVWISTWMWFFASASTNNMMNALWWYLR